MTQVPIAEAKAHFSDVLRQVEAGDEIIVTRGVKKEAIAAIIPMDKYRAKKERKLGTLEHWAVIEFADDWSMTDEELLAS
ncbi:MAG: type II toxin-antitoxin system prevent-host-death family antitoxin [Propionibacteriaceae bacterium]|jgi:prevent-host-death family protein|nr:type II toxin-antitoxin system prevent-host-death family antitoxin [Propionibacteriaceae bacterium]